MKIQSIWNTFWLFIILLFSSQVLSSEQTEEKQSTSLFKRTGFKQYASEQGLNQNTIQYFYQDTNQFMWIATLSGLNRLDGNQIENFVGPDSVLAESNINYLKEDSQGALWVASANELIKIEADYNHYERYYFPQSSNSLNENYYIISVIEETPDLFWVITDKDIFQLRPKGKDIFRLTSINQTSKDDTQIHLAKNYSDTIWLATNKGLYQFNKKDQSLMKYQLPKLINDIKITDLVKINNTSILVTSAKGALIVEQSEKNAITKPLVIKKAINHAVKLNNRIFFSVNDEIHLYNIKTKKQSHLYTLSEILPRYVDYQITQLNIDQNGKLWIGTDYQGAYVWEPNSLNFNSVTSMTGNPALQLSNRIVWGFIEGDNNDYWIGTDNGLNHLQLEKSTIQTYLTSQTKGINKKTARIFYVLKNKEILWLGTADGLIKYNINTHIHKQFKLEKKHHATDLFIFSMTQLPNGEIWLATKSGAISFNPKTEKFHIEKILQTKDKKNWNTYIKYIDGRLWLGYPNRLDTFDYKKKIKSTIFKLEHEKKIYNLSLTDIHLENDLLWVSFNATGIYVINLAREDKPIIKHLNKENGLIDNTVHTLTSDGNYLWASTHKGLVKINKNNFSFLTFGFYDGLPITEFNEGASLKTAQGKYLFGGANGILSVSPQNLKEPKLEISPTVTSVKSQGNWYSSNAVDWSLRNLKVKESKNLMIINLSVFDYLSPQKWHYEYWLSGEENTKPTITSKNQIVLANLVKGNYKLHIRTVLPNYKKFKAVTTLPFKVTGSIWNSKSTTKVILPLVLLMFFWWLYHQYKNHQELTFKKAKLLDKNKNLELALLNKNRGLWDWKLKNNSISDSIFCIIIEKNKNIVFTALEYQSYIHPSDQKKIILDWYNFLQEKNKDNNQILSTFRFYFMNHWRWYQVYGRINKTDINGKPISVTGSWIDINLNKLAEEKLRLYKRAIQSTRDIIFIIDDQLNILSINNAYEASTGYKSKELIGKNILSITKKRLGQEIAEDLEKKILMNSSWQTEATMPISEATSYPVNIRVDAIKEKNKTTHYIIIITDISFINEKIQTKKFNSYYDSLTGLPNKALANDRLSHAIEQAKTHKNIVVLIHLDLNNFDFDNEILGKNSAKEIILNSSKKITQLLNKNDTLARVDKSKFHIILENEKNIESISLKINTILIELSKSQQINHSNVNINIDAGVAYFPHDASSTDTLIQCAIDAKKQAHALGKNKIHYYHKELNKQISDKLVIKNSLQQALKNNQFYLVFQPKYYLQTNKVYGFEVFVRWKMKEGNIIYPSQFLKMAEEVAMIEELNRWLINQSFRTLYQWKQDGINTIFSINLNPQYFQKADSLNYLLQKLDEYKLTSSDISIEINEKQFSNNINNNLKLVNELSQHGFKITLDDFGYGNTPFCYLKNLPINAVKIDRNFIRNIGKDKSNDQLLNSLISMMNNLGYIATAKGIEYKEQLEYLTNSGCILGQGYYFSDPLTESVARSSILS